MKILFNKINSLILIIIVSALSLVSCEESNLKDGIREISFKPTASSTLITAGNMITYKDSSLTAADRVWTFEGGNIETSSEETIEVTYPEPSTFVDGETTGFTTELEVTFADGSIENNVFRVSVYPKVQAEFIANKTTAIFGSTIEFTDQTTSPDSAFPEAQEDDTYLWEFEGGTPSTSTEKNPSVTYPNLGNFNVKLTVHRQVPESDDVITKSDYISIIDQEAISPLTSEVKYPGEKIILTYEEPIQILDASNLDQFSVKVDGSTVTITSAVLDASDATKIIVTPENPVTEGQAITLSLSGTILAAGGAPLAGLVDKPITNGIINLFSGGAFEGIDGPAGDGQIYNTNAFLSNDPSNGITAAITSGSGVDGTSGLVYSFSSTTTSGNNRTLFGDGDSGNIQLVQPILEGKTYAVIADIKYTGVAPSEFTFNLTSFPFSSPGIVSAPISSGFVDGEFVQLSGELTPNMNTSAQGGVTYPLISVTGSGGVSEVTIDNIKVYEIGE